MPFGGDPVSRMFCLNAFNGDNSKSFGAPTPEDRSDVPLRGGTTMSVETSPLIWITRAYAVNPASIALVFHGNGGEVQITLAGRGDSHTLHERDLTTDGRALLLPPAPNGTNGSNDTAAHGGAAPLSTR
jgi:hypothetical protein